MIEILLALYIVIGVFKKFGKFLTPNFPMDMTLLSIILLYIPLIIYCVKNYSTVIERLLKYKKSIITVLSIYVLITISLAYSSSPAFKYTKYALSFTNLLAFAVPLLYDRFSLHKFAKAFVSFLVPICLMFVIIYPIVIYPDARDTLLSEDLFSRWESLLGVYLSVGYLLGFGIVMALYLRSAMWTIILINFFAWVLWGTTARGPLLFLLGSFGVYVLLNILNIIRFNYKAYLTNLWAFHKKKLFVFVLMIGLINWSHVEFLEYNHFARRMYIRSALRMGTLLPGVKTEVKLTPKGKSVVKVVKTKPKEKKKVDLSVGHRLSHLKICELKIPASIKSLLIGYGFGSYGMEAVQKDIRYYPHNILLELWFEIGVLAVIWWLLVHFKLFRKLLVRKNFVLVAGLIYIMLNSFKSSSFVDHRLMFAVFAMIIVYVGSKQNDEETWLS